MTNDLLPLFFNARRTVRGNRDGQKFNGTYQLLEYTDYVIYRQIVYCTFRQTQLVYNLHKNVTTGLLVSVS